MTVLHVYFTCPACHHRWLGAHFIPDAWWADGNSPEACAKRVYCPVCDAKGPMQVETEGAE